MTDEQTPVEEVKETVEETAEEAASKARTVTDRVSVAGGDLVKTVQSLLREAAVRKITVQDKTGRNLIEIPLYAGMAGAIILGYGTVLALIAAWFAEVSILIERDKASDEHSPTVVGDAIERAAGSISTKTSELAGSISALFGNAARTASDATRRAAESIEGRFTGVAETFEEKAAEAAEAVEQAQAEAAAPHQCAAITKSGTRCKRMAVTGSDFCAMHQPL
ncbi:DUF4342 domain-containing protein [Promineifilum sp.]|uniref:DUF4342 domain-containing protein n=1 Tax=Promineifilum sp. TaxID=2664178 RepID=UPI0035B408E1